MGAAEKQDDERPMTAKEAADWLRIKPSTIRTLIFRGKLVPDHRGGCGGLRGHRFLKSTLKNYFEKHGKKEDGV